MIQVLNPRSKLNTHAPFELLLLLLLILILIFLKTPLSLQKKSKIIEFFERKPPPKAPHQKAFSPHRADFFLSFTAIIFTLTNQQPKNPRKNPIELHLSSLKLPKEHPPSLQQVDPHAKMSLHHVPDQMLPHSKIIFRDKVVTLSFSKIIDQIVEILGMLGYQDISCSFLIAFLPCVILSHSQNGDYPLYILCT